MTKNQDRKNFKWYRFSDDLVEELLGKSQQLLKKKQGEFALLNVSSPIGGCLRCPWVIVSSRQEEIIGQGWLISPEFPLSIPPTQEEIVFAEMLGYTVNMNWNLEGVEWL